MRTVLIGVQARSSSKRLPDKIHMPIAYKPVLQWVLDACKGAIRYLRNDCLKYNCEVKLVLLVPHGDKAGGLYKSQVTVIEGDERDVLSRYKNASDQFNADYVVRVTADCIFLQTHIISKFIKTALIRERDYTSNTHIRTFREGLDCEVISKKLLNWLSENATDVEHKEHVTSLIHPPNPFPFQDAEGRPNIAHMLNYYDDSELKTSIDTQEDFDRAKRVFEKYMLARKKALQNGVYVT